MSKKILVALDNSDYADKVMLQAIELAKLYKTPLLGVSVVDDSYFGDLDDQLAIETKDYWTSSYQTVVDKCIKMAKDGDIDYSHAKLKGNPAEQIIKYAEEKGVDIIILGHLGKTAAAGFQIGSVAQKVSAYAKCSVLVVK